MSDTVHIAFCISAGYLRYIQVTMRGLVDNNADNRLCVHVFSDAVDQAEWQRFCRMFGRENIDIRLHLVDDHALRRLKQNRYTVYAWYRILIPDLLADIDKVLYLDTDIAIAGDLAPLYRTDIEGRAIAAVLDDKCYDPALYRQADMPDDGAYVCSGVILMNLAYWRQHRLAESIIDWALANADHIVYPDQDTINHVCRHSKVLLPLKYGITQQILVDDYFYTHYRDQVVDCLTDPVVIHYNSTNPWFRECQHPLLGFWDNNNAMLGRHKAPTRYLYKPSMVDRLKTRLWFLLHPSVPRYYGGWDKMVKHINKHGIVNVNLNRLKNGL